MKLQKSSLKNAKEFCNKIENNQNSDKMKIYKSILIIAAVMASLSSLAQQPSASELLKDIAMQDSVMTMIANDHQINFLPT